MAEIVQLKDKARVPVGKNEPWGACARQTICSATPVKPFEADLSVLLQTPVTPSTELDIPTAAHLNAVATPKPHLSVVKRKLLINGSPENTENLPATPKSLAPSSKESVATPKPQLTAVKRKLIISSSPKKNATDDMGTTPVAVKKVVEAVKIDVVVKPSDASKLFPIKPNPTRRVVVALKPLNAAQPLKCSATRLLEAGARVREERIRKALNHFASVDGGVGASGTSIPTTLLTDNRSDTKNGTVADRSQSLLDRIRQRSEANKQWQAVRDSTYTTKLATLQRARDLVRLVRGYFMIPRSKTAGGAVPFESLVEHLYKASASAHSRDQLRETVEALAQLLPDVMTISTAKDLSSSAVIHAHQRFVSVNMKANLIEIMSRLKELNSKYEREGKWDALVGIKK